MINILDQLKSLNTEFESLLPFVEQEIAKINNNIGTHKVPHSDEVFSHKDTVLITYPDQFYQEGKTNLQCLNEFLSTDLMGCISHVHILPFYPWTSDDGFSPKNYHEVEPSYGSWKDVEDLPAEKMFDCVFNHLSSESEFFQQARRGDLKKQKMFHVYCEKDYNTPEFQDNITKVVRPRITPLFTAFDFNGEQKYVWTTFSADQVDTNIENIDMFKYILESFFLYIHKGARFFRVDAVPFIWKELGTNCSHLEKTHLFIKLLRSIVDKINLKLLIITESNVPHHENITYFGNGYDEAHIVYNFSLAPLLLHALVFENNKYIHEWASRVFHTSSQSTYLNFTATHDGIGMRGVEGLVPDNDIQSLCDLAKQKGGEVGLKRSRDGTVRPYELNVTWASIMEDENLTEEELVRKVVNSHAVVMFFPGIGAHYVHNFFGTKNWQQGFEDSGIARRLNREKLPYPISYTSYSQNILDGLKSWIEFKNQYEQLHPKSYFEIVNIDSRILSFERGEGSQKMLFLFNLTRQCVEFEYDKKSYSLNSYELKVV